MRKRCVIPILASSLVALSSAAQVDDDAGAPPAYTSGTGTPEPGGMTNIQAFEIIRRLCAETNVIGIDVLEIAPDDDPTKNTLLNTNRLIRNCLTGIALRKAGVKEADYRSPLTVDDGR